MSATTDPYDNPQNPKPMPVVRFVATVSFHRVVEMPLAIWEKWRKAAVFDLPDLHATMAEIRSVVGTDGAFDIDVGEQLKSEK